MLQQGHSAVVHSWEGYYGQNTEFAHTVIQDKKEAKLRNRVCFMPGGDGVNSHSTLSEIDSLEERPVSTMKCLG